MSSPAAARARWALHDIDTLLLAAEAAGRLGSWEPGAANNLRTFCLLGDAADILDAHRRWA